ncbi:MAG: hypothetical protein OEO82_10975 [Gammaproteobacteria bacterium]|nr:hypothetical protein [Gammaproteobacteria bacterium]
MTRLFFVLVSVTLLASVMIAADAFAADEDTQASVYLVFDPETGEFVTVDDPSVTAQHAAAQKQEEIDSGTAGAVDAAAATDAAGAASGQPPMVLAIGAAVAVLVLGGVIWMRRGKQDTA